MTRLFSFWLSHPAELANLFAQPLLLFAGPTMIPVALGGPLGVLSPSPQRQPGGRSGGAEHVAD